MKDYKLYLIVIRECLGKINAYLVNGKDDFMNSQMTQDAVFLNLEIIGKSIKNLPQEWKDSEPDIEWLTFVNLSDILTYDYFQINLENVWLIIDDCLQDLDRAINRINLQFGESEV
ncbi:DUF86 domain-containing protein (plasmid) [Cyanobacterium sp. IPPAS B-1200]|uniref:HepT-like ribonuclease domain-containing protein n=1 Tax=Cyanobacterium sp. IPPAS B-1200 TaxID=1562720 RepID=UPI00085267F9|nr:HepT-like ribonuclease domain-containing protein [Cyanobacterium sp. IPPAS B-1200]OEJ80020.1 hypothetical protein A5482_07745 [Cyanobacterium sp. IPPAS B-1200]